MQKTIKEILGVRILLVGQCIHTMCHVPQMAHGGNMLSTSCVSYKTNLKYSIFMFG